MLTNQLFCKRMCGFFLIQLIFLMQILIHVLYHIFRFWLKQKKLHEKGNKNKMEKSQTPFSQVKYLTITSANFKKDWSNTAVVGAHERLYSESSETLPVTKQTLLLPLGYSRCLLCNILIQHICLMSCISLLNFQIIRPL